MTPTAHPIVVHLPSLGHRKICVAGLARGHPDSGEAAIMGVPLPHLVLPLSRCLSRHTPTRATQGEARGHRSALAQNSLLMYPLPFHSFGLVVGLVCPRHMVEWPQCVCAVVSRCRCPGTQQVPMVVRPSWEQWFLRGCVCQSRSFNPHWLPQMVGEVWEGEGTILRHSVVGLSRGGDVPL